MSAYGMAGETGKGPYAHRNPVWQGGVAVNCGDAIFTNTGATQTSTGYQYDSPAGSFTGATNHVTTQTNFKAVFRGYSQCRRTTLQTLDGDGTEGMILATGEFRKPCAALGSVAQVGAYVGPAQGSGGALTLDPQKVEIVSSKSYAIGFLTRAAQVGATELFFQIFPAIEDGGVQGVV